MDPVMPTYGRLDLAFEKGEGCYLIAADGTRYLDMGAGIAVNVLGHAHPHLVEALTEQAGKLWHTSNLFHIPGQQRLAARLCDHTFADTVFFTNSGAEAMECAIKMARKYMDADGRPERYRVITVEGAFHGRTLATIAAGNQEKHLKGFGPKVEGFDQVAYGSVKAVRDAVTDETAAILVEPIQGEGGIRAFANDYLRDLRTIADECGILLIFDEVQTGVGRTGKLFAHEWAGIAPDIMGIAKGIGGGFPLGACLATEDAAKGMTAGSHGSTFGGNPLAMAVGNAVIDEVTKPGFLDHVLETATLFRQKLARLCDDYPHVFAEIRGAGLMIGLKLNVPNTDFVARLVSNHVLSVGAGDNVVRLLPPLIIEPAQVDAAIAALETTAQSFTAKEAS